MTYSPLLLAHILGGIVGCAAGFAAMFSRKGGRLHRRAGDVFVIAMLVMASSGALIAFMKGQRFNILAGTYTVYLVSTAWLIGRRRDNETGRLDVALLVLVGAEVVAATYWASTRPKSIGGYVAFAVLGALAGSSDVRMLLRGGYTRAQRMLRHVWRMGFALFIATGSFFLGTSGDPVMKKIGLRATLFTKEVRATHLPMVPVLLVLVMTLYWIWRVKFTDLYKKRGGTGQMPSVAALQLAVTAEAERT